MILREQFQERSFRQRQRFSDQKGGQRHASLKLFEAAAIFASGADIDEILLSYIKSRKGASLRAKLEATEGDKLGGSWGRYGKHMRILLVAIKSNF